MQYHFTEGEILLFDKPCNWTSFDIVNKVRIIIKRFLEIKKIKVGHAGTLDPLASGLLVLCTGAFTKKIEDFKHLEKEYTGTIFLGATTPSYDLETETNNTFETAHITEKKIIEIAQTFTGIIKQTAPMFSAKKINGERLYDYARKGKDVEIPEYSIEIKTFEITRIAIPEIDFRVVCGKGTYIRSLAHDFGLALKSGAYLKSLRRTRIGEYMVNNAMTIADFEKQLQQKKSDTNVEKLIGL